MRKILLTNKYGAGWSSWCSNNEVAKYIATYQPIINLLERDKDYFKNYNYDTTDDVVLEQLKKDVEEKFGLKEREELYLGGAKGLYVLQIRDHDYIVITDHDGKESYTISENGI